MTQENIIARTIEVIRQLPTDKAEEISDFADYILKKFEDQFITKNIQKIVSDSEAFSFLLDEEDLYSEKDLKEKYTNDKR